MRLAVAVIDKIWSCCMYCSYVCTFVYLQTARASPFRLIGDVTEAETHQAAERMPVVSALLTCLTR